MDDESWDFLVNNSPKLVVKNKGHSPFVFPSDDNTTPLLERSVGKLPRAFVPTPPPVHSKMPSPRKEKSRLTPLKTVTLIRKNAVPVNSSFMFKKKVGKSNRVLAISGAKIRRDIV